MFKAEGRANAKALRQGTALARLRTGSRKGIKKGSSRKRMRAVTGRWTAAASDSVKKGLLTSETVLRCEVRLTYSPKATYRITSCF